MLFHGNRGYRVSAYDIKNWIGGFLAIVDVISTLFAPIDVKALRSFLRHAYFYKRFIKGFSHIAKSFNNLLGVNIPYNFSNS